MDPEICLAKILDLALKLKDSDDDESAELAEKILDLNDWILNGGYLPEIWRHE